MKTVLAQLCLVCTPATWLVGAEPQTSTTAREVEYVEVHADKSSKDNRPDVSTLTHTLQLKSGKDYVVHLISADSSSEPFINVFRTATLSSIQILTNPDLGVVEFIPKAGAEAKGLLIIQPKTEPRIIVLNIEIKEN